MTIFPREFTLLQIRPRQLPKWKYTNSIRHVPETASLRGMRKLKSVIFVRQSIETGKNTTFQFEKNTSFASRPAGNSDFCLFPKGASEIQKKWKSWVAPGDPLETPRGVSSEAHLVTSSRVHPEITWKKIAGSLVIGIMSFFVTFILSQAGILKKILPGVLP